MSFVDKSVSVSLTDPISKMVTYGTVIIRSYDPKEKRRRMIRHSGGCFLAACASVFIPIFHFFLVPGFLIASVVMIIIYSQPDQLNSAQALCPHCHSNFLLSKGKPEFPIEDICATCHRKIEIQLVDQAPNN